MITARYQTIEQGSDALPFQVGAISLGRSGLFALVDAQDFLRVAAMKWHVENLPTGRKYAARGAGAEFIRMHQAVLGRAEPGMDIDHINGNGLDNRRANLRFCSRSQNIQNSSGRRSSSSSYRGVCFVRRLLSKPWSAGITVGYRRIHLGYFETPELAAAAYDAAAIEHFGPVARTNFGMAVAS